MRTLHTMMTKARRLVQRAGDALLRLRLSNADRRIRQVEHFLAREQDMHAEQMLLLRTELQRLRDARVMLCGETHQYTSGALQ